ncbi:acyltransferase domain-containing protein [Streptomyces sp. CA-181903]|uniref:acyltransferase domain-containing protein n=1 Tax=Streptomyces sp. CA-181903 TaxID=3240055 RepID=UPI003D910B0C
MTFDSVLPPPPPWLLVFSAATRTELTREAKRAAELLANGFRPDEVPAFPGRPGPERLAVSAADVPGLVDGLSCFADNLPSPRWTAGRADGAAGRAVWCFGGHGSQWAGMGRALPGWSPVAAGVLAELDGLLPGGVTGPLARPPGAEADGPGTVQPLIFALQVATARWLLSLGLRPDAVVGHSLGEVAAAHVAGVLTLPEAARVVATRSRLLARARQTGVGGAMATIGLDRHTVARHCARTPGTVVVAAHSAPRETVVTGAADAVGALVAALGAEGVRCRAIRIDAASHSPYVDGVLAELRAELAGLAPAAPRVPWVSTVDAVGEPAAGAGPEPTTDTGPWSATDTGPWSATDTCPWSAAEAGPQAAAGAGPRSVAGTAPGTATGSGPGPSGAAPEPSGGGPGPSGPGTPDYWARNLRRPVRFTQAVSALAGQPHDVRTALAAGRAGDEDDLVPHGSVHRFVSSPGVSRKNVPGAPDGLADRRGRRPERRQWCGGVPEGRSGRLAGLVAVRPLHGSEAASGVHPVPPTPGGLSASPRAPAAGPRTPFRDTVVPESMNGREEYGAPPERPADRPP